MEDSAGLPLQQLVLKKDEIEKEIANVQSEMQPFIQKNYHENLVDKEGFPREDLDWGLLCQFSNLKKKQAELINDHKAIMREIEQGLHALHAQKRDNGEVQREMEEYERQRQERRQREEARSNARKEEYRNENIALPFATITEVTTASPSEQAGILVNDLLVQVESVNIYNHSNLSKLAQVIKENQGKQLKVIVLRRAQPDDKEENLFTFQNQNYVRVELTLTPQTWGGQGLVGCRFKPI